MPTQPKRSEANPLEGIERLLVDGSNLLHALRRGLPAAPAATLIGRLRGIIEMPVRIEILFDGPTDLGMRDTRIASGVTVRYSGRLSADAVLERQVVEALDPGTVLVVTDDAELRHQITRRGGRTVGTRWLIGRLERSRLEAPAIGRPKPPPPPSPGNQSPTADDEAAADRPGWRPGRGATTKRGNPRKAPRTQRPRPRP